MPQFQEQVPAAYRSYIQGQVAKGKWQKDGIGFTGSETGADGAFTFTPGKASVHGDTVTVPFGSSGSVYSFSSNLVSSV